MANSMFNFGRESFAGGSVSWSSDNIKLVGVDHGTDTPVPATDDFLSDILVGARIFTSANFTTKTITDGILDSDDVTVNSVTGSSVESLSVYKDTGTATTSILLLFIDTATGLPFTPNGGNVTVQWDNGTNKIAKI